MTKPVLYLSGNVPATIQELEPKFRKFNRPMLQGTMIDGTEFRIISARNADDQWKLTGLEFSALKPMHSPNGRCLEIAATRVR